MDKPMQNSFDTLKSAYRAFFKRMLAFLLSAHIPNPTPKLFECNKHFTVLFHVPASASSVAESIGRGFQNRSRPAFMVFSQPASLPQAFGKPMDVS